jgi:hypothetical protein
LTTTPLVPETDADPIREDGLTVVAPSVETDEAAVLE